MTEPPIPSPRPEDQRVVPRQKGAGRTLWTVFWVIVVLCAAAAFILLFL